MTTTTVYSGTADGNISSYNADYATASSGSNLSAADGNINTGQYAPDPDVYFIEQGFISFDTSAVPDTDTVSAAVLSLYGTGGGSTELEARAKDWGASLTTADWVAGGSLAGLTLFATWSPGTWSTSSYNAFVESGTNFQTGVNKTGTTYVLLCDKKQRLGNAPGGNEYAYAYSANEAGTTLDPKLVVTHAAAAVAGWMRPTIARQAVKRAATW